jgi:hypothetical protein
MNPGKVCHYMLPQHKALAGEVILAVEGDKWFGVQRQI